MKYNSDSGIDLIDSKIVYFLKLELAFRHVLCCCVFYRRIITFSLAWLASGLEHC